MIRKVWIIYPCAARKSLSIVNNGIKMMEQYAQYKNYKVAGFRILENSFLSMEDYAVIHEDMKNNE